MKIELCKERSERLWCTITADLTDGRLSVSGHDMGPAVEEFFGDDEHEYAVSLDAANAKKLFLTLQCDDKSDEEKLQVIKRKFHGNRADSELREYCKDHEIETSFWCWP